jgi:hypothetical protein
VFSFELEEGERGRIRAGEQAEGMSNISAWGRLEGRSWFLRLGRGVIIIGVDG